jgi:hypothetical protein
MRKTAMTEPVPAAVRWFARRKQSQEGVELVAQEQRPQVAQSDWTATVDDEYCAAELSCGAAAYAMTAVIQVGVGGTGRDFRSGVGAFPNEWILAGGWRPVGDPEGNLAVASALIARELDRLRSQKAARMTHDFEPISVAYQRIESTRPVQTETGVGHECADRWFL